SLLALLPPLHPTALHTLPYTTLFRSLFTRAKAAGETLTDADIVHAFCLGEEDVLDLVGRGPVGKSLRYLLRQIERAGVEPEDERSEEHTSDLQSRFDLVCRLLLDKKN